MIKSDIFQIVIEFIKFYFAWLSKWSFKWNVL